MNLPEAVYPSYKEICTEWNERETQHLGNPHRTHGLNPTPDKTLACSRLCSLRLSSTPSTRTAP